MSMIKCPECQSEISDKAESCPKCGYPIAVNVQTPKQENVNKEVTPEQKAKRKKLITRACICGGIVVIVCVAITVRFYIVFSLTFFYAANAAEKAVGITDKMNYNTVIW